MNEALPIHLQMLVALRKQVEQRQRDHERKTGKGLEDRDYQRHVGRIAECGAQIEAINEMMKADLDEVADRLEEERDNERSQRTTSSHRRGQRGAKAPADH